LTVADRQRYIDNFMSLGIDKMSLQDPENWVDGRFSCRTRWRQQHDLR